uniref:Uncharacterized protein n=1 Tax=Rhizophora mucronata TaxID=61149 RepID=A0A2P2QHM5_RHIMU
MINLHCLFLENCLTQFTNSNKHDVFCPASSLMLCWLIPLSHFCISFATCIMYSNF